MKRKRDCSTPVEYRNIPGKRPRLILKRKKGAEATYPCPFCGTGHIHGTNDGHRVAHCGTAEAREFVTAPDGTILYQNDGYILVTI